MKHRRALVVLVVLVVSIGGIGVIFWRPVWRSITHVKIHLPEENGTHGWYSVKRWGDQSVKNGRQVIYDADTGTIAFDGEYEDGEPVKELHWNREGKLIQQLGHD